MFKKIPHSFNLNTLGPNVQTLSFTFFFLPLLCFILELCTVQAYEPHKLNIPAIKQDGKKKYKKAPTLQKTPSLLSYASLTHQSQKHLTKVQGEQARGKQFEDSRILSRM